MAPLIVLIVSFLSVLIYLMIKNKKLDLLAPGRIAMAILLLFTAIGHFRYTEGMEEMIPLLPAKKMWAILTGIIELAAGTALLMHWQTRRIGWLLIIFFVLILPANIYAAVHRINYQDPGIPGPGVSYLWFRIPLQILFVLWTYVFIIHHSTKAKAQNSK